MNQETEIRTDIPVDFHPGAVQAFAKDFAADHPMSGKALAAVTEALNVAYTVHGAINDAEKQLRALTPSDAPTYVANGKMHREHGSEEQLAKAAEQATTRALQTIERRAKEIQSYESVLRATVNAAIDHPERKTPHGIAEGAEIRAHVKSLPETERFTFVSAAITRGDTRTVSAILHSPSYLSGLDDKSAALARKTAEHKFAPAESKLLDGTAKALDRMAKGAASLVSRTAEVTGLAATRAAKRAAALEKLAGVK